MTNDIFEPLVLSAGSHKAGSGRGCAMNVISWENGDTLITDYPACSDPFLAQLVQGVNDRLADRETDLLSPENSLIALELGHATVGTSAGFNPKTYTAHLATVLRPIVDRARVFVVGHPYDGSLDDLTQLDHDFAVLCRVAAYADTEQCRDMAVLVLVDVEMMMRAALYPVPEDWERTWPVDQVREVIARFKEVTGIASPVIDPQVTACAVERMRVVA